MFNNAYVYYRQDLSHKYQQSGIDIREGSRIYDPQSLRYQVCAVTMQLKILGI